MQNRENLFKGSHHQNLENIHLSEFLNLIISPKNAHVFAGESEDHDSQGLFSRQSAVLSCRERRCLRFRAANLSFYFASLLSIVNPNPLEAKHTNYSAP